MISIFTVWNEQGARHGVGDVQEGDFDVVLEGGRNLAQQSTCKQDHRQPSHKKVEVFQHFKSFKTLKFIQN